MSCGASIRNIKVLVIKEEEDEHLQEMAPVPLTLGLWLCVFATNKIMILVKLLSLAILSWVAMFAMRLW